MVYLRILKALGGVRLGGGAVGVDGGGGDINCELVRDVQDSSPTRVIQK